MKGYLAKVVSIVFKFVLGISGMVWVQSCTNNDDEISLSRGINIENDEQVLSERITYSGDTLEVTDNSGGRGKKDFELILEGEIAPPQIDGKTLQAVAIYNSGGKVFVSYNHIGSDYLGGVDYITDQLVLKASIQYKDADVNSVAIDGTYLYMVGATALDSPSYVERVKFTKDAFSLETHTRTFLGSYAATSVITNDTDVFVTTGNDENRGGGLYQLNDMLDVTNFLPLHDARWVSNFGEFVIVAQGTPGTISTVDAGSFGVVGSFEFDGADIAESKTTIDIEDNRIFIAGGVGGVPIYDLSTGAHLYTVSFDDTKSIANAVTAQDGLLFISAGTRVYVASYDREDTSIEPEVLGKIVFADDISANHLLYRKNRMFIASGLGGVKIIKVVK